MRSVNKSRGRQNWVRNEPEYVICVICTNCLYYKALKQILCDLILQINHNYNRLHDGHFDVTGRCKMSVPGTTDWWEPMQIPYKGATLFCVLCNLSAIERRDGLHIMTLSLSYNLISNLSRISDWSVHYRSYLSIWLGPLQWVPTTRCASRRSLNLWVWQPLWPMEMLTFPYACFLHLRSRRLEGIFTTS